MLLIVSIDHCLFAVSSASRLRRFFSSSMCDSLISFVRLMFSKTSDLKMQFGICGCFLRLIAEKNDDICHLTYVSPPSLQVSSPSFCAQLPCVLSKERYIADGATLTLYLRASSWRFEPSAHHLGNNIETYSLVLPY